ncbi:MAG: BlaI/MecI/CopY family transcriptional regulator [Verrucomicrobiales bacterium]
MPKRPKDPTPKISASEWEVMSALWRSPHPLRASEVLAALPPETGWAQKTVNTFLARLVEKGAAAVEKRGGVNAYAAAAAQEDCVREEAQSFLSRVFRGAAGPAVMHFIENGELSDAEIEELKRLLDEKK